MTLVLSSFPMNCEVVFPEDLTSAEKQARLLDLLEEVGSTHSSASRPWICHILTTETPTSIHSFAAALFVFVCFNSLPFVFLVLVLRV